MSGSIALIAGAGIAAIGLILGGAMVFLNPANHCGYCGARVPDRKWDEHRKTCRELRR